MSATRIVKPTGPTPKFNDDLQISYVPGAKKIGTISGDRYQLYSQARTVGEALKLGSKRADVNWDWERGLLQVVGPYVPAPTVKHVEKPVEKPAPAAKPPKPVTTPQKPKQTPKKQTDQKQASAPEESPEVTVTPQKAQTQAAPLSPVKRVRSLALPRVLQRAARLAARATGGLAEETGLRSEEQAGLQAAAEASMDVEPSDAPMEEQPQDAPASAGDAMVIESSEGGADGKEKEPVAEEGRELVQEEAAKVEEVGDQAAPTDQTDQGHQAEKDAEEPMAKRARTEEQHEQQAEKDQLISQEEQEGDLGEEEPEMDPDDQEEGQTSEALPPIDKARQGVAAPPPVSNGARRLVKHAALAGSLHDGVALGGEGGMVLPVAGFGTYKLKKGEAKGPVLEALRAGFRLVDTAQVYENEADVGLALRESGVPREEVVLETKVWRSSHGYDRTMKAFKQSLKKLGVEYIDLYLIHWPGAKTGWPLPRGTVCPPEWTPALRDEGTWRAMEDLYLAGKVKAIGVANYSIRHLEQLLRTCRVKPMVNQVEFHPRLVQTKLFDFCRAHGIQVQAYASLGSSDAGQAQAFFAFPPVQAAAKAHQVTPAQVLLRWALEKGALVVPKSCKAERIQENAQLFAFSLTADEVQAIDKLNQSKRLAWKGLDPDTIE